MANSVCVYNMRGLESFAIMYSRTSRYGHLSNTDTSLLRTVSYVPKKILIHQFSKKPLCNTDPLIRTTDTKSRPLGANSYKLNLFITDPRGQGVDNLRYMYHFLSAVIQTLTLHQPAIPIPEHVLGEVFRFVPKFVCTACN